MLYREYYEAIYKFCFRMLGNHENAMDTTQETFIKLYERMKGHVAEIENTRAWLYKVAGNLCVNILNTNKRRNEIGQIIEHKSIENATPENILIQNEKNKMVKQAIQKLNKDQRLLVLMYQDGLSYLEVAEASGINPNSVGKTLWRVIDKLSETLKIRNHE